MDVSRPGVVRATRTLRSWHPGHRRPPALVAVLALPHRLSARGDVQQCHELSSINGGKVQTELVSIEGAGHDLAWTRAEEVSKANVSLSATCSLELSHRRPLLRLRLLRIVHRASCFPPRFPSLVSMYPLGRPRLRERPRNVQSARASRPLHAH
ncbi:hypothetical protein B0H16DRAFT_545277 [Mycena metata]|uniref:Uncharacterized protein n=1 Tax=Mycena metata TaxID=1033252 RepID=A0AAD7MED9_9AGAR|nr:hypothetical protein B0H16DRAFT_545277 [Mycena metata]